MNFVISLILILVVLTVVLYVLAEFQDFFRGCFYYIAGCFILVLVGSYLPEDFGGHLTSLIGFIILFVLAIVPIGLSIGIYLFVRDYRKKGKVDHEVDQSLPSNVSQQEKIKQTPLGTSNVFVGNEKSDEVLVEDSLDIINKTGKISAAQLQRHLNLGWDRASHIIQILEERGYIGPRQGAKPREIFLDRIPKTQKNSQHSATKPE